METEISFDIFWDAYDKKVCRKCCEKKWAKLKDSVKDKIISHVKEYVKATPNKQYRKNPETYLNNECWNDEIINYGNDSQQPASTHTLDQQF